MQLSTPQKNELSKIYDSELKNLIKYENQSLWLKQKAAVVHWCVNQGIELYNILSLKDQTAINLLNNLIDLFTLPSNLLSKKDNELLEKQKREWITLFSRELKLADKALTKLHNDAYLSVADQYKKTRSVSPESLLTDRDMKDLLNNRPANAKIQLLYSMPFSLDAYSSESLNTVQHLIVKSKGEEKDLFLPLHHDGHWFYLLNEGGQWTLVDSQPLHNNQLSTRQNSMLQKSEVFLKQLDENIHLNFRTSGKQLNDYACGSHVINDFYSLIDEDHECLPHKELLEDLLLIQLEENEIPDNLETVIPDPYKSAEPNLDDANDNLTNSDKTAAPLQQKLSAKAKEIIETTSSSQLNNEKRELYKTHLTELVESVLHQGLFKNRIDPIPLSSLNSAKAKIGEEDEAFAIRLQEAECRRVGLMNR